MIIGIDLGGTKIAAALADDHGKIITDVNIPTEAAKGQRTVIDNVIKAVAMLMSSSKKKVTCLGIGVPGPILYKTGIVIEPPNLPGWKQVNLKKILEKRFKIPVQLDNDANCAALAEAKFGAGRKAKDFLYITVSTGIGGGVIIDRKLYRGAIGAAGEFGHMIIDPQGPLCGCGNHGCFEALASGTAIKKRAGMDAISVELAARQGDEKALQVIRETAHYLAIGFANLVNVFNPELIVVGGGVSKMRELLFNPIREEFKKYALTLPAKNVQIVRAKLGDEVGVLGAIALCL